MADGRYEEHDREVARLCFEYFKHFTTISTAAALVELALYQQFEVTSRVAVAGVVMLALTLLLSVVGMLVVPLRADQEGSFSVAGTGIFALMIFTAIFFVSGAVAFGVAAATPPYAS